MFNTKFPCGKLTVCAVTNNVVASSGLTSLVKTVPVAGVPNVVVS